jgi:hypothetical protein
VARRERLLAANLHTGVRAASIILCVGVGEDRKGKAFADGRRPILSTQDVMGNLSEGEIRGFLPKTLQGFPPGALKVSL